MKGKRLTRKEIRARAYQPKPSWKKRGEYLQWWKARTMLGLPVKSTKKSQTAILEEIRQRKAATHE